LIDGKAAYKELFIPNDKFLDIGKNFLAPEKNKKDKDVPFDHNLEFLVDPFFKKTTQLFDESNASGMLMNNIPLIPNHMLLLDSTLGCSKRDAIDKEI
jgi:hypothetical protein